MTIAQLMNVLAKRRHPNYPWQPTAGEDSHWILSQTSIGFGSVAQHLEAFDNECMVCDQLIGSNDPRVWEDHAERHAREYNLLPLL
jgi:hypothetical protein